MLAWTSTCTCSERPGRSRIKEGLGGIIEFREGNAETLPFPDDSFDVTVSCTVLEEVSADLALAEMVRVTRPGGRVAVAVRAEDVSTCINIHLRVDLKTKA